MLLGLAVVLVAVVAVVEEDDGPDARGLAPQEATTTAMSTRAAAVTDRPRRFRPPGARTVG